MLIDLRAPKRRTSVHGPYLQLSFPDRFWIDTLDYDGAWTERGPFRAEDVECDDRGRYTVATDGVGVHMIQCIADHGDFFVHVSAGGIGIIRYCRLVASSDRVAPKQAPEGEENAATELMSAPDAPELLASPPIRPAG